MLQVTIILFVTLEVITTSVVNQDTGTINYVLNENAGNVIVCLMKDLVTDDDFIMTFIAQEKTPPDALCKIELLNLFNNNNNYVISFSKRYTFPQNSL